MDSTTTIVTTMAFSSFLLGLLIGVLFGEQRGRKFYQEETIERGLARYNPETSDWEWITTELEDE